MQDPGREAKVDEPNDHATVGQSDGIVFDEVL